MFDRQEFSNELLRCTISADKTDTSIMEVKVSPMSQIALNSGLGTMSELQTMYVEADTSDSFMKADEKLRRVSDLLLRKTLVGDFPWNSVLLPEELIVNKLDTPSLEVVQLAIPVHSPMKDHYAGRMRTDHRAHQFKDD